MEKDQNTDSVTQNNEDENIKSDELNNDIQSESQIIMNK